MEFKNIELTDREWMEPFLKNSGYQGCDYTFGNLYIWKDLYRHQAAQAGGMLCIRSRKPGTGEYTYLFPAGGGQAYGGISGYVCDRERQGGMGLSVQSGGLDFACREKIPWEAEPYRPL